MALWEAELGALGLPIVVRCLAAWWRLPQPRQAAHPPGVLAAALATLISQVAGVPHPPHQAAAALGAGTDLVVTAAGELGQHLELSAEQPW